MGLHRVAAHRFDDAGVLGGDVRLNDQPCLGLDEIVAAGEAEAAAMAEAGAETSGEPEGGEATEAGEEATSAGDDAASTGDDTASTGDDAVSTGDGAASTGDDAASTGDGVAAGGENAVDQPAPSEGESVAGETGAVDQVDDEQEKGS